MELYAGDKEGFKSRGQPEEYYIQGGGDASSFRLHARSINGNISKLSPV